MFQYKIFSQYGYFSTKYSVNKRSIRIFTCCFISAEASASGLMCSLLYCWSNSFNFTSPTVGT